MKDSKQQNPARKSTPIDVEGRVNNNQVSEEVKEKKKHKCLKEKLPIILSVVLVMGVAVGVYFVVVSTDDNKNDKKSFSTKSQRNKTSKIQSTDESVDVIAGLVEVDDKEINGTGFATDPICRDFMKSSVFVFDCFHQRAFNNLPLNSTVKCSYLNKVGLCIQSLLENEYEVDCNRLDQLYLLNLNAEVLMERSNFNVRSECGDWYEFYLRATNTTLE